MHLHHSPENGAELDWTLDHCPLLCIMYSVYLNTLKCWNCTCCTHCALCLNCDYCAHCAVTVLCLAHVITNTLNIRDTFLSKEDCHG